MLAQAALLMFQSACCSAKCALVASFDKICNHFKAWFLQTYLLLYMQAAGDAFVNFAETGDCYHGVATPVSSEHTKLWTGFPFQHS